MSSILEKPQSVKPAALKEPGFLAYEAAILGLDAYERYPQSREDMCMAASSAPTATGGRVSPNVPVRP